MSDKILCYLFYFLARFFHASYRYRFFGTDHFRTAKDRHPMGAFCLASWHENALAGVLGQKGQPYCFLISPSRDGTFVDFLSTRFGFTTVRGSSSRGGKEARRMMEEKMLQGISAAFTVDGPRGPRNISKAGVLVTASNTATAILPVAAISSSSWTLEKTWDKTKVPKPFSKIVYQFGEPIIVEQKLSEEQFQDYLLLINERLKETELKAFENIDHWSKGMKKMP